MMQPRKIKLVSVAGTSRECGRALGEVWRKAIRSVSSDQTGRPQWWREKAFAKVVERHVPHLPELYEGLAEGAKVPPRKLVIPTPSDLFAGCTSFAVAASHTVDGRLLCGQTKDTPLSRLASYQVLKMKPTDAPALLTLTYPGMLFGHGFINGGCSVFRNSLHAREPRRGKLPYQVWGLLALYCRRVADVVSLLERHGVREPFHCTVCDSEDEICGIENGRGGSVLLHPRQGIYVHANHVESKSGIQIDTSARPVFLASSKARSKILRPALVRHGTKLTPRLTMASLASHEGFPKSVCNHESEQFCTSAAIVAEPASGRLWVTAGPPCEAAAIEYCLG